MPLFSRIARSIQGRMTKSAEDNPDGALAKYLWLWQSMGKRPGRSLIPRPLGFFFVVSLDVLSLVGWYVRTGILRVAASVGSKEAIVNLARSKRVAGLTIVAGGVIGASLSFGFLGRSPADEVPPVVYEYATTLEPVQARSPEGAMTCRFFPFRTASVNGSRPDVVAPDERPRRYLYSYHRGGDRVAAERAADTPGGGPGICTSLQGVTIGN